MKQKTKSIIHILLIPFFLFFALVYVMGYSLSTSIAMVSPVVLLCVHGVLFILGVKITVFKRVKGLYLALRPMSRLGLITIVALTPIGFPLQLFTLRYSVDCQATQGLARLCDAGALSSYFFTLEKVFFQGYTPIPYSFLWMLLALFLLGLFIREIWGLLARWTKLKRA